jgi:hypothetical protein
MREPEKMSGYLIVFCSVGVGMAGKKKKKAREPAVANKPQRDQ